MASLVSTGSPKTSRKPSPSFKVLDQNEDLNQATTTTLQVPHSGGSSSTKKTLSPLQSTSIALLNVQAKMDDKTAKVGVTDTMSKEDGTGLGDILARLRLDNGHQSTSPIPALHKAGTNQEPKTLDKLLTNLNGQSQALKKQQMDLKEDSESDGGKDGEPSSDSDLFTPATESFDIGPAHQNSTTAEACDVAEMLRIKKELAAAKSIISRQEQELTETRTLKHTMDQAMGPPSEIDFGNRADVSEQTITHLQSAFNATARPFTSRSSEAWHPLEDSRSDNSEPMSGSSYNRGRGIWRDNSQTQYLGALNTTAGSLPLYGDARGNAGLGYNSGYAGTGLGGQSNLSTSHRLMSGPSAPTYGFDGRFGNDAVQYSNTGGMRRTLSHYNRPGQGLSHRAGQYCGYPAPLTGLTPASLAPLSIPSPLGYQPRPIGTPLSPDMSDFTSGSLPSLGSPWSPMTASSSQTYVTPLEPMNYRRLLDKTVSCDWKYIVDKIVCSNDQQASIFLQQKLKVGTAEQKFDIVEAIVNQAYPLMINRFGNFLVQRCFEHGTPDQIIAIANAIHGNVLSLSMDAFGCHVIQKAFDSVPEQHKADMVRELLRRIPDTVIHRYACHVWQKLFELRWSGEPPQIMLKVNEALHGMWHEVALGETGSLVVQNIFENCVEEEKRPAIEEVIANIDLIAHGQFGNWCIQHLCEHGSPPDKRRVIDHILNNSYSYSIDQFASKVVEKCLKIGGIEFLERYLAVITTAHPDRPRIPLIDISGDQYGNYLIQWILMNTHHHQREQVAIHIRKHMVSLRGSKFGSRVAMLCCNPASVTRPGPGVIVNPFGAPGQPRGWGRYR